MSRGKARENMRFIGNGPPIPDALLQARDEGRVVFFCGAGVSQARARLPDFFGLAETVLSKLGSSRDSDASRLLRKLRELETDVDVTSIITADRVFAMLEREFRTSEIQSAVAAALKPGEGVDRSAHEILRRLARTPAGKTQLVTTNFDRLFESDSEPTRTFQPPHLPQPSRDDGLDGVVYLHGCVDVEYKHAEGNEFVLSSSDFGHAYLSEGWATKFFRKIVREYVVVFIGYSADDPPVQYLLEGLSRSAESSRTLYAFQCDGLGERTVRWQHKGVSAIPYSRADGHRALWETLESWAERADDPQQWRDSVLQTAMKGPRTLMPHQRGQVAHIVSVYDGAKAFANTSSPAEWLCVFDATCRYERPETIDRENPNSPANDPFSLYGLDFDEIPQRSGDDLFVSSREVPSNAWDAFELNELDQKDLSSSNLSAVRGILAANISALPRRLACFANWIAKVANQPAAVWWAARQEAMHPHYRRMIEWTLPQFQGQIDGRIQKLWRYILEAWDNPPGNCKQEWFDLSPELKRHGWSRGAVRRFIKLTDPKLRVRRGMMSRSIPPAEHADFRASELARIEVECPVTPHDSEIPDEWLHHVVKGLRANIETAVRYFEEVGEAPFHVSPIVEDERPDISDIQRTRGFSGCVVSFATLYERLVSVDEKRAKEEFEAWPSSEQFAFARLRFWASGKPIVATAATFTRVILEMPDDVFWGSDHQRDLLIVLARRWDDLMADDRQQLEARFLRGPTRRKSEDEESYKERLASAVLQRLCWLKEHNCRFSFDVDREIANRREDAPDWNLEFAKHAADSLEMRGGFVETDTEYSDLLHVPIDSILTKAEELSGRSDTDYLVAYDPFAGLCAERPKRAYLALACEARRNKFREWAWTKFLNSDSRKNDRSSFAAVIAERLCRIPGEMLLPFLYSATSWLQKSSKVMSSDVPEAFDRVVERFIDVVEKAGPAAASSLAIGASIDRDWATEAINSPVGEIVIAIFNDVRNRLAGANDASLKRIEQCLSLPGDPKRHAMVLASHHLEWLFEKATDWTERNLLAVLGAGDDDDREAFWAGVFWNPRISSAQLFQQIKNGLLYVAKGGIRSREGHAQSLATLLLKGWVSHTGNDGPRWVSSSEFREILLNGGDKLRAHVLWRISGGLGTEDSVGREEWQRNARMFFNEVWPLQRIVKTQEMTFCLCQVLVAHPEGFVFLDDVVSPLLTKLSDATRFPNHFLENMKSLIEKHPGRFLGLLHCVLPEDTRKWPYGMSDAFDMIEVADESLRNDARLRDLRRKWNSQ